MTVYESWSMPQETCKELGETAAETLYAASQVAGEKEWKKPAMSLSLHPRSNKHYSEIVKAIREFYAHVGQPIFETATIMHNADGVPWYGCTDFYMNAKDAANLHGQHNITVFWPSRLSA